jgi:hypothetical protein
MLKKTWPLAAILVVMITFSVCICTLKFASASTLVFFDDFDGPRVDTEKWVVQENTDWSGYPANGGLINVAGSKVYLSSNGSSFPCVTSTKNPFPGTGDFAVQFDLTYTCISDWGVGFWITKGAFEYQNKTSNNQIILQLWAGAIDFNKVSIKGYFLVDDIHKPFAYESIVSGWEPSAPTHVFRLEYINETYSLIDNGVTVASAVSKLRPDTIGFGHPPIYWLPHTPQEVQSSMGGFGSFNIDYIKIEKIEDKAVFNNNKDDDTQIFLFTNLKNQQIGYKIDVIGTLKSLNGTSMPDKQIILWFSIPGVSTWYPITSVTTDTNGVFSASWIPTATGTFSLKAEYTNNQTNQAISKIVNISITQVLTGSYFAVESNSTLSSLTFNSTANVLSFSISGPSGTNGYTTISIPKSLLSNPENLKLYIDNQQTQFNYTSKDNSWLLTLNYSHSTHDVLLKIGSEDNSFLIYVAAVAVIVFCALLSLALIKTFSYKSHAQS